VCDHGNITARLPNHRRLHEQGHHLVELYHLVLDRDQEHPADRFQFMMTDGMVPRVAGTEIGVPRGTSQEVEALVGVDENIEIGATHEVPLEGRPHQGVPRYRRQSRHLLKKRLTMPRLLLKSSPRTSTRAIYEKYLAHMDPFGSSIYP